MNCSSFSYSECCCIKLFSDRNRTEKWIKTDLLLTSYPKDLAVRGPVPPSGSLILVGLSL